MEYTYDNIEVFTEIKPQRDALQEAWKWTRPQLLDDLTLPRDAVNPSKIGDLISKASLIGLVYEDKQLVDLKIRVWSSIMTETTGEKTGKTGTESLARQSHKRSIWGAQQVVANQRPILGRAYCVSKELRRVEHLALPIRHDGKITEMLVFSDVWFAAPTPTLPS